VYSVPKALALRAGVLTRAACGLPPRLGEDGGCADCARIGVDGAAFPPSNRANSIEFDEPVIGAGGASSSNNRLDAGVATGAFGATFVVAAAALGTVGIGLIRVLGWLALAAGLFGF
jgi:hypothetical protein